MLPRLVKLALKSDTFREFVAVAAEWPQWYGYPNKGTQADYLTFYFKVRGN